jgi:hypothetical protein
MSDLLNTVEYPSPVPEDVWQAWVEQVGGRFQEAFYILRAVTDFDPRSCLVGAWLSLSKDDRGELDTQEKLANFLGVRRQSIYRWRMNDDLDEWAVLLRRMFLQGEQLGEVDRVMYQQAIDPEAPIDSRRLYYQRAGVLPQEIKIEDQTEKKRWSEWLKKLQEPVDEDGEAEVE